MFPTFIQELLYPGIDYSGLFEYLMVNSLSVICNDRLVKLPFFMSDMFIIISLLLLRLLRQQAASLSRCLGTFPLIILFVTTGPVQHPCHCHVSFFWQKATENDDLDEKAGMGESDWEVTVINAYRPPFLQPVVFRTVLSSVTEPYLLWTNELVTPWLFLRRG